MALSSFKNPFAFHVFLGVLKKKNAWKLMAASQFYPISFDLTELLPKPPKPDLWPPVMSPCHSIPSILQNHFPSPDLHASHSHSLPSPMTFAPTPCLLLPLLPVLVHSNRLPSYLLFTQALQPANFPLCSKPTSGQRLFGVALDCLLFPATAQRERA